MHESDDLTFRVTAQQLRTVSSIASHYGLATAVEQSADSDNLIVECGGRRWELEPGGGGYAAPPVPKRALL